MNSETLAKLNEALRPLDLPQRVALIARQFPDLALTTAFGTEDQLLTWAIIESGNGMQIATHLTGPLLEHAQTLRDITQERYDISIETGAENGGSLWISGRSQHVVNADRSKPLVVWHADSDMLEIDPLADWSFEEVLQAVAEHEVPINPLFDIHTSAQRQNVSAERRAENRAA